MNICVFFSICFISALSSCIYGQNDREIIAEITNKVRDLDVREDKSFDYLIVGQKILEKNLNDIRDDEHQKITICCSNGVLCCNEGKMLKLDNNGINNIYNLDQHGPVFTYVNTNNHDSTKQIKYIGEIGNDNENENANLLNDLKTELDTKKINFEKSLLDKIVSILENVFNGIDDRKDINISQYLKKKNDLRDLVLANINDQNGQNQIVLKLKNIYSFISKLDKMFDSNSVFTEDVSELKHSNTTIITYNQENNEEYREKANNIKDLKAKILKKMNFCVADSIFEKINKKEFFNIFDLEKIENSLNFLKDNYKDLFHFEQPNVLPQLVNLNIDNEFFKNLKDFFEIICDENQYKDIFEDTDHYNDINGILEEIQYNEGEKINYSTFIKKIQKNLVGIYKKLLLIYFEKYLESQKNKIDYMIRNTSMLLLDNIIKEIKKGNVEIELFSIVSKIYTKDKKNLIDESEEDEGEEEDIVENKEIIKKFDLDYFNKYFEIRDEFRENITFDELNEFKNWFVLSNLDVILKKYRIFLMNKKKDILKDCDFYIPRILKCKELLDQQPDFLRLLSIIGNLYEYYLKENPKESLIKDYLERIKLLQDFYPEILKEINPNEIGKQTINLNKEIEDLLSSHFGNFAAEKILGFVKEFNEKDKENNLLNANKIFIEKEKAGKFSRKELENIFLWLDLKSSFLDKLPITYKVFNIQKEKIEEIINCINLAIINRLLIKIDKFVNKNINENKVLNVNKLQSVEDLKKLLMNKNEKKEEKDKDKEKENNKNNKEKKLNLYNVIECLNNILDGFGLDDDKNNLNKFCGGENKENKKILEYKIKINIKESGELLGNINDNLNKLSKTIETKKEEIAKKKVRKISDVFKKYLKQCHNFISSNKNNKQINYLEENNVSKFLEFHSSLKKWENNSIINVEKILNFFDALKNFKAFLIEKLSEEEKKKFTNKEEQEELEGINKKDIFNFEKNKNFNRIKGNFDNIVHYINEATKDKLIKIFKKLQKLKDEKILEDLYKAIQKEDNCGYFKALEEYLADEEVNDISSFFNRDDINIWVLNNFAKTIDKCINKDKDKEDDADDKDIKQGFSIPGDIVKKIIGKNNFKNFKNKDFLNKLSNWYNFFSNRLKQKILNLINNCLYLVNTDKGEEYLNNFLNEQLGKDNLPKYIKDVHFEENKKDFEDKIKKLKKEKSGKYKDITDIIKDKIVDKGCKINNPLFRYFVAYCMKEGVAILPNPDYKENENKNGNQNEINDNKENNENKNENLNEIKDEKENKDENKNEKNEEKERIDLYTYLTRNYSDNTRKDLENDSLLEKDKDKNPSFKELEKELFDCNEDDKFLHDYLNEEINLEENKKEAIIDLFSKYIIPFSSDVQEVFHAKLCKKVSGDVVEGDETVENLGTKGTAAEAFVYNDKKKEHNPLLIKIVRPEMQCKSEVKMLYETLINLKIKTEQQTNHKDCKNDCSCKNVIKIHNVFYCKDSISKYFNGALIVVMDYAEQGDMKNKIKNEEKDLPLSTISSYFKQLVNGLEFLHRLNILHMDVKLANIVYGDDGNLKLIDFGYSIFYNNADKLKEQIKYVPSNSFWVMSLEQFKIFFKQFEIEIKEKCNKKIEKEIKEFITKYFFGDKKAFSHPYEKNEGFNIFDRIDEKKINQLKELFEKEKEKNIAKIGIKLKNLSIEFQNKDLDQENKEKYLNEFLRIYDIYKAIMNLGEQEIKEDTTKDDFINKNINKVFPQKNDFEFFKDYFENEKKEISKKVCEHYYDEQKIITLKKEFDKAKYDGEFKEGYNVFQSDWCALLTYVLALSYRPFFDQVFIEDLEKDAKDKLEQIDRQKLDNILEKYCYLLFNSIFKVKVDQKWEDSNDVSKKYEFKPKNIFLHEDMNSYLHYSVRNVLEYIMNTCFVHDKDFDEGKEKEIIGFLKKSKLYNYKGQNEVTTANKEAGKRVDEFRFGKIETLLEKYKQCENVEKLVVKEEITDIEGFKKNGFEGEYLIGNSFLSCFINNKDKPEQPKIFIFEEKKEDNQENKEKEKEKEKENNIEIEIVNGKKIKVTKGNESALDLKKRKYALFKIKTKGGKEVYLYCSDIETKRERSYNNGFFEECEHSDISVIACDTRKITNLARMFSKCKNLKNLNISEIDTSNVTDMSYMFSYCEQIKNLDISNFNVENVNNIYSMFGDCKNLETLNFKHFNDLGKNTECEDLFYNCKMLTKIEMDNFDKLRHFSEEKDTKIFNYCTYLDDKLEKNKNKNKEQNENEKISIVNILEEKIEEEKQKIKEEEEKKIKEVVEKYEKIRYPNVIKEQVKNEKNKEKEKEKEKDEIKKEKGKKDKNKRSNSLSKTSKKIEIFQKFILKEAEKQKNRSKSPNKMGNYLYAFKISNKAMNTALYVNSDNDRIVEILEKIDDENIIENKLDQNDDYIMVYKDRNGNHKAYQNKAEDHLKLGDKKYALFEIKTKDEETVYLYCSDVRSGSFNEGIFKNKPHISISVIACDTENVRDMHSMFSCCSNLTEINFGNNFNTTNVENMKGMFEMCSSLTEIDLIKFNTKNVMDMSYMFYKCGRLTKLDLKNFDTENVTNMGKMFYECSSLKKINFENKFNASKVTNMMNMFYNCSNLTEIDLTNFKTENVTDMRYMFEMCKSLKKINFGNTFNTLKVTNMMDMFYNCSSLTELDLKNFNTENVTNMGKMFYECSNLKKINFGNTFNTSNVKNMINMFYNCSSLTEIDLIKFNTKNVENMEGMFEMCSSLTELNLNNFNTENVSNMKGMFYKCKNLKKLDLKSFDTANVNTMESMFSWCSNLTEIDLTNFKTKNVTNMKYMFYMCKSLKKINFENTFDTSNVCHMAHMFSGCSSLKEINLKNFDTSNVCYFYNMFYGCSSLKELNLQKFDIKNVYKIEKMLYFCISLKKLTMSDSLYKKLLNGIDFGNNIFKGCSEIKNFYDGKSDEEILKSIYKKKEKEKVIVIEVKDKEKKEQKDEEEKSLDDLLSEKVLKLNITNNLNENKNENENKIENEKNNLNENKFGKNKIKKAVNLLPLLDFYLKHTKKEDRLYKHIFKIAELYKDFTEEQNLSDYFISKYQDKIIEIGNFKILSKIDLIEQCLIKEILEKLKEKNKNKINEKDLKDEKLLVYIKEYTKEEEEENKKKKEDKNKNKNEKDNKKEELFINSVWKENNIVWEDEYYEDWIVLEIRNDKNEKQKYYVNNINSIEIGQEKIGLFKNVQNIEIIKISIPENFIEGINDLSYMFYGCNQLKKVIWEIKDDKTKKISNVTNFSHMFYNCISLYNVNFEVFDTKNVTDMSYMFYNCEDIASISEPLHTQIYGNFEDKLYKTCFYQPLPNGNNMRQFQGKGSLFGTEYDQYYNIKKKEEKPYFEFSLKLLEEIVERVYDFYQYIRKKNPNDFKDKYKQKEQDYKEYLKILRNKEVKIDLFQLIVDQIYGFKNEDPIIKEWLDYIIDKKNGTLDKKNHDKNKYPNLNVYKKWEKEYCPYNLDLYTYKKEKEYKDVKGSRYKEEILKRKNLNCEDKFDYINLFFLSKQFEKDCNKIKFENFDTSNVNNMAYMFYGCKYLYELDLKNWNLENVRNFEGMFAECRSLRNLTLGKNKEINKKTTILRKYMFYNCKNLRDLDISNEVAKIDDPIESRNMFLGTTKLRTISCKTESEKAIKENMEILGLCKDYKNTYEEMKKYMKGQVEFAKKEEFKIKKEEEEIKEEKEKKKEEKKKEEGKRVVKDEKEILDYKFYDRDKINNFIKCTNIYTIENLFSQYKNNFEFDVIEISDINSKKEQVEEFMNNNAKKQEGYVFDIICKEEESGKYRNYIIYTNKIVSNFFENNKCIIYVDCLYADKHNINTVSMFSECTNLLFVDISKIKMRYLNNTFYLCKKLQYVFLPKSDFWIFGFSFYNCDNLKLVTNIENCSKYSNNKNFNTSEKLLYFMVPEKKSDDKDELKCKYFDSSNNFHKDFYPTKNLLSNNPIYIISTKQENFIKYVKNGYTGNFLMSKNDKDNLQKIENEEVQKQKEEEVKKKEEEDKKEDKKDEKKEEKLNIKNKKEKKKTFWKEGIVKNSIKTFEEFKFNNKDFAIIKNENEEEVKTVDQIFYRFVQDEIKEIDDFLKKKMEDWNNSDENKKTYENFKNVFVVDYERKNLFVLEEEDLENDDININGDNIK